MFDLSAWPYLFGINLAWWIWGTVAVSVPAIVGYVEEGEVEAGKKSEKDGEAIFLGYITGILWPVVLGVLLIAGVAMVPVLIGSGTRKLIGGRS